MTLDEGFKNFVEKTWDEGFKVFGMMGSEGFQSSVQRLGMKGSKSLE